MAYFAGGGLYNLYKMWEETSRWLDKATKHGTWTKYDQYAYDFLEGRNALVDLYKSNYERETYMDRHGLDYGDVRQPWNLPGGSAASLAGSLVFKGYNYMSSNVGKLYK